MPRPTRPPMGGTGGAERPRRPRRRTEPTDPPYPFASIEADMVRSFEGFMRAELADGVPLIDSAEFLRKDASAALTRHVKEHITTAVHRAVDAAVRKILS